MFLGFRTYKTKLFVPKFNISNVNSLAICSQTLLSKTSVLSVSSNTSPKSVLLLSPNEQTVMVNTLQIVICLQKKMKMVLVD